MEARSSFKSRTLLISHSFLQNIATRDFSVLLMKGIFEIERGSEPLNVTYLFIFKPSSFYSSALFIYNRLPLLLRRPRLQAELPRLCRRWRRLNAPWYLFKIIERGIQLFDVHIRCLVSVGIAFDGGESKAEIREHVMLRLHISTVPIAAFADTRMPPQTLHAPPALTLFMYLMSQSSHLGLRMTSWKCSALPGHTAVILPSLFLYQELQVSSQTVPCSMVCVCSLNSWVTSSRGAIDRRFSLWILRIMAMARSATAVNDAVTDPARTGKLGPKKTIEKRRILVEKHAN